MMLDLTERSGRMPRLGTSLASVCREMHALDREFESLTPQQQRAVDLADRGMNTLTTLQFNLNRAESDLVRAMRAARGSAPALLAAGRTRRQATQDWNAGLRMQDRQATREAANRLSAATNAWNLNRAKLLNVRNAQQRANTAEGRLQRAYPMQQQRLANARQALASSPGVGARIARWVLGRR
jgi:hypothetical protein